MKSHFKTSREEHHGPRPSTEAPVSPQDADIWTASPLRKALPQVLATLAQSLLLLALGMMVGVPTLVIAALLDAPAPGLTMTAAQASWFAGILLGCQPLGSVLSGVLSETLGRKYCMLFVAIPQLAGWVIMYLSQDLLSLYCSALLMGFSIGFMEAPGLSYVGEITQPHLRANMCSLTSVMVPVGFLVMYLLGTLMTWRNCAACSAVMPLLTVLAISQVPESPLWLLRKGRVGEAQNSLCWLRGWVAPAEVGREFSAMQAYDLKSRRIAHTATRSPKKGQIYIEVPKNGNGPRLEEQNPLPASPTFSEKLKDLSRPEMLRPLRLVCFYFFFYHCGSISGIRPYLIPVFHEFQLNIDAYWLTVASASLQIAGAVVCMLTIHHTGKRFLSLVSMSVCSLSVLLLGGYALLGHHQPLVPLALFATLFFFTHLGIGVVPWALISEVFPPRGRGMGGGLSSAAYYLMFFLVSKTWLDLEGLLGLAGVFLLYGSLGLLGLGYLYCCLPETEGRRLEDIEDFFRDKTDPVVPIN